MAVEQARDEAPPRAGGSRCGVKRRKNGLRASKFQRHFNIMAPPGGASTWLDTPRGRGEPSTVRALAWTFLGCLVAVPAHGQAPPSTAVWRVVAASLPIPVALADGAATAAFWNPAASHRARLAAGIDVLQTSDVLGLAGIIGGAAVTLGRRVTVGVLVGRVQVDDLVRTTTSPTTVVGSIPVYNQMVAGGARVGFDRVRVGALLRVHDSRFDTIRESGVTADVGVRVEPVRHLVLAVATHFLPVDLGKQGSTDYYFGAEYEFAGPRTAGLRTAILTRYGAAYRPSGDLEHSVSAGVRFEDHVRIDGVLARESAFGRGAWRPGIGLELRVGRYAVSFARSVGINDVDGAYRIGLDVEILR